MASASHQSLMFPVQLFVHDLILLELMKLLDIPSAAFEQLKTVQKYKPIQITLEKLTGPSMSEELNMSMTT